MLKVQILIDLPSYMIFQLGEARMEVGYDTVVCITQ